MQMHVEMQQLFSRNIFPFRYLAFCKSHYDTELAFEPWAAPLWDLSASGLRVVSGLRSLNQAACEDPCNEIMWVLKHLPEKVTRHTCEQEEINATELKGQFAHTNV